MRIVPWRAGTTTFLPYLPSFSACFSRSLLQGITWVNWKHVASDYEDVKFSSQPALSTISHLRGIATCILNFY